jgi:hypothetical protein
MTNSGSSQFSPNTVLAADSRCTVEAGAFIGIQKEIDNFMERGVWDPPVPRDLLRGKKSIKVRSDVWQNAWPNVMLRYPNLISPRRLLPW